MIDAVCLQHDPELWFPAEAELARGTGAQVDEARALCHRCPVREACLEGALERGETHGVFGALTPKERRQVERDRQAPGPALCESEGCENPKMRQHPTARWCVECRKERHREQKRVYEQRRRDQGREPRPSHRSRVRPVVSCLGCREDRPGYTGLRLCERCYARLGRGASLPYDHTLAESA